MLACVWGGGGREAGQASGHWNEPFLCPSCWCAPVFWVQCLFFYLIRAVPAISKQNIVPTKRWYSPFPLFWDYLAWILPHDYAREIMMISSNNQVSCLVLLQGKSVTCGGTLSWMARRKTFAMGLQLFKRQVFLASYPLYLYMPQCIVHLNSALWRIWALLFELLALTPREHKLTRLLFSPCVAVFSLVWLMRSIQTRLPWPLTPPTSGFPVYTMTTACTCGMSKTRRKWARCTLLCITLPVCGTLRYVCRYRCWIVSCSWESHQTSCQIWMQTLTVEGKNWLQFSPVVGVFATGPGNSSLAALQWLTECMRCSVLLKKKNLTIKRWEVGEGAELNKAECRASF